MKYHCSGEVHEIVTPEECMACALKHDNNPPCGFSYPILKSMFASQSDRSEEVHVTDLTGCLRKAYYTKTKGEVRYVHELAVLWVGIAIHNQVEQDLKDDPHFKTEVSVGEDVKGRVDLIRENGDIVDLKTTGFLNPSRTLPYGNHAEQVNIYRDLSGEQGKLFIQYISTTGASRCRKCRVTMRMVGGVVQCPSCGYSSPSSNLGAHIAQVRVDSKPDYIELRGRELGMAIEADLVPEAEPGWLCTFCPFTDICPESEA